MIGERGNYVCVVCGEEGLIGLGSADWFRLVRAMSRGREGGTTNEDGMEWREEDGRETVNPEKIHLERFSNFQLLNDRK